MPELAADESRRMKTPGLINFYIFFNENLSCIAGRGRGEDKNRPGEQTTGSRVSDNSDRNGAQEGIRILVAGRGARIPDSLRGVGAGIDLRDPADLVLIPEGAQPDGLALDLARHGKALLPIVNASDSPFARADFTEAVTGPASLERLAERARRILERLRELPEAGTPGDRAGLDILAMAWSRGVDLLAAFDPSLPQAVTWPLLDGLGATRELLEDLADSELLKRRPFDMLHMCGHCDSSRLHVREECTACRSGNLRSESLVHHYRCAHQGPAEAFERPNGGLICPKCSHELRHYGVDYDRPAEIHRCGDCGQITDEPAVGFICMDCGKRTDAAQAGRRSWFHYALTPQGVAALRNGALPARSLGGALARIAGTCSLRDFRMMATFMQANAERYRRPLTAAILDFANHDALLEKLGGGGMNRLLSMLAEIIARTLRTTDIVALSGSRLFVLFSETAPADVRRATGRMRERIDSTLAEKPELACEIFEPADWQRFMEHLP